MQNGQRVAVSYADGNYTVTHIFPRDIFGHWTTGLAQTFEVCETHAFTNWPQSWG